MLTTEANLSLISTIQKLIDAHRKKPLKHVYLKKSETLVVLGCSAFLMATFIYLNTVNYQFRNIGYLAESLFLLVITAWNGFIFEREARIESNDSRKRILLIFFK